MMNKKRFLSVLLALVLVISLLPILPASAGDYGLFIKGRRVTDSNRTDVWGDGIFEYSPAQNILYIKGDATADSSTVWMIESWINNLWICPTVDCVLDCATNGIRITNDASIRGDKRLTISVSSESGVAIQVDKHGTTSNLNIQDANVGIFSSYKGINFATADNSALSVINSTLSISADIAAATCDNVYIRNSDVAASSINDRGFRSEGHGSFICESSKVQASGYSTSLAYYKQITLLGDSYLKSGSYTAADVLIARDGSAHYDLFIEGRQVMDSNKHDVLGDGTFTYNSDNNTLTVKQNHTYDPITAGGKAVPMITVSASVVVRIDTDVTLTVNAAAAEADIFVVNNGKTVNFFGPGKLTLICGGTAFKLRNGGTLNFQSAKLDIPGESIKPSYSFYNPGSEKAYLYFVNSEISVTGADSAIESFDYVGLIDSTVSAVGGSRYGVYGQNGTTSKLSIDHSELYAKGNGGAVRCFADLSLKGVYMELPADGKFDKDKGCVADTSGLPAVEAHFLTIPDPQFFSVTFDANGHGTAPDAQTVEEGETASKPADPSAEGWIFGGWYTNKACTSAYDFSAAVTADLILYAKWTKVGTVVTAVDASIAAPAAGQKPSETVTLTVTPSDANIAVSGVHWWRWNEEKSDWDSIDDPNYTFEAGERYGVDIGAKTGENTVFDTAVAGTINGKPGDATGPVYKSETEVWLSYNWDKLPGGGELKNPFVDVKKTDYFYDAVLWAYYHSPQVTNGLDKTHFGPYATCTRGQIVTFLWRALGEPAPTITENPFVDVKESDYYYKAVLWAYEKGVTTGTDATHFAPGDFCKREHAVAFLYRAAGKPAYTNKTNPFVDVSSSAYYYDAVLWAVEKNITKGVDATHFGPTESCQRCQIVTFLYRFMNP